MSGTQVLEGLSAFAAGLTSGLGSPLTHLVLGLAADHTRLLQSLTPKFTRVQLFCLRMRSGSLKWSAHVHWLRLSFTSYKLAGKDLFVNGMRRLGVSYGSSDWACNRACVRDLGLGILIVIHLELNLSVTRNWHFRQFYFLRLKLFHLWHLKERGAICLLVFIKRILLNIVSIRIVFWGQIELVKVEFTLGHTLAERGCPHPAVLLIV